jgi:transposase
VKKIPKQEYTAEFKEQAVKHAQATGIPVAAKELGLVDQAQDDGRHRHRRIHPPRACSTA